MVPLVRRAIRFAFVGGEVLDPGEVLGAESAVVLGAGHGSVETGDDVAVTGGEFGDSGHSSCLSGRDARGRFGRGQPVVQCGDGRPAELGLSGLGRVQVIAAVVAAVEGEARGRVTQGRVEPAGARSSR
ncbi:hypothetical protein GCM10027456_36770 [Kineosporia babensis]